jgi:hypothetical protein
LRTSFFAGIRPEEGRHTGFKLAYGRRKEFLVALEFDTPLDLMPSRISKLDPAAGRQQTLIGVYRETDLPKIWGLIPLRRSALTERSVLNFTIQSPRAGVLFVSYLGRPLLGFSDGRARFTLSPSDVHTSGGALPNLIPAAPPFFMGVRNVQKVPLLRRPAKRCERPELTGNALQTRLNVKSAV